MVLSLIAGTRQARPRPMVCDTIGRAIRRAQRLGFAVGARVMLGAVEGEVIGYNVASHGLFFGGRYPLLISTRFGVVKCGIDEATLTPGAASGDGTASA